MHARFTSSGLSLLLVDRDTPGISVRKMRTQFDNSHNTTYIVLEDVSVPCAVCLCALGLCAACAVVLCVV